MSTPEIYINEDKLYKARMLFSNNFIIGIVSLAIGIAIGYFWHMAQVGY